jgi:CheY-like chemotaxis protein/anti-sigma regulatory factor (Ser/Thr protein kinase)
MARETCAPLPAANRHALDVVASDARLFVDGDEMRLSQVLSNLIDNAAKYSPAGSVIHVSVERVGEQVAIAVRDHGMGIPTALLKDVFQRFFQVDRSLERSRAGLGIGLTLARELVELHGGSISAASEGEGKGSAFTVTLPLSVAPAAAVAPNAVVDESAATRLRILVADDNRDAADSLSLLLALEGHEAHTAYNGEEALAAAQRLAPDAVLVDIGMPKMSGYEVARRLRGTSSDRQVVLVAVTGWGQDDDRRRSLEAGFDLHLVKPVEPANLVGMLRRVSAARAGHA